MHTTFHPLKTLNTASKSVHKWWHYSALNERTSIFVSRSQASINDRQTDRPKFSVSWSHVVADRPQTLHADRLCPNFLSSISSFGIMGLQKISGNVLHCSFLTYKSLVYNWKCPNFETLVQKGILHNFMVIHQTSRPYGAKSLKIVTWANLIPVLLLLEIRTKIAEILATRTE